MELQIALDVVLLGGVLHLPYRVGRILGILNGNKR